MPLSFERFQGEEGVFSVSAFYSDSHKTRFNQDKTGIERHDLGYVVGGCLPEPTSVLDALRSSPSSLASTTTTAATAGDDKCSQMGLDDLERQEQTILRLIMDPTSGFGVFDPGFGFGSGSVPLSENSNPFFPALINPNQDLCFLSNPPSSPPAKRFNSSSHQPGFPFSVPDPGHDPFQNQCLISYHPSSPPAKRFNSGSHKPVFPFSDPDPGHDPFQQQFQFHQSSSSPAALLPVPPPLTAGDDDQTVIISQLFKAAELIGTTTGNNNNDHTILAQGILARLNHHLSYTNNNKNPPFQRAASHITKALLSLLNNATSPPPPSPSNLILQISAHKTFSETSPFLQFVNFTANQTILEELGHDRRLLHVIDFDVGYGGQWSSLIQELARNRASSLKLTVFATVSDELELRFTEENLRSFAGELKVPFEIEVLSLELLLNPLSLRSSEEEAIIAVNLPLSSVVNSGYLPLILRFIEQLSPNVVVCSDRGCDQNDAPFPNAVIHALEYHTTLLESLDASQGGDESVERFWVQPCIEKMLVKRHRWIERSSPPWRSLFALCGFAPVGLSQTSVAQAECLMERYPVRGFRVEKRQGSLVMCWQRKELVTVSAWKC